MQVFVLFSFTGASNLSVHSSVEKAKDALATVLGTFGNIQEEFQYDASKWVDSFGTGMQYVYDTGSSGFIEDVYILQLELDKVYETN
jgi:hypothetical protein